MSISQDRVLALLAETQDLLDRFRLFTEAVQEASKAPDPAYQLRMALAVYGKLPVLPYLIIEQRHFKSNARRNQRVAERQRKLRRAKGIQPREYELRPTDWAKGQAQGQAQAPGQFILPDIPETYAEAQARGGFSAEELAQMFPDEAPSASQEVPASLYQLDDEI